MRRYYFPLLAGALIFMSIFLPNFVPCWSNALANTMYVTGIHLVNMRREPNMESGIINRARSGEPINILKQEGGWSFIRTPRGEEGWVLSTLLTEAKPLAEQLETLASKAEEQSRLISQLSEENASLKKYVRLFEITDEELKHLKDRNVRLKNQEDQIWAAVGASILILGWIVGLITRAFPWRKRSGYRYVD